MYKIRFDEQRGLLKVTMLSGLKVYNADKAISEIIKYGGVARARFGQLHMLLDARKGAKLPDEAAARFGNYEKLMLTGPNDRMAVLVDTHVHKQQTRHAMQGQRINIFVSESSALTWLTGQVHPASQLPGSTAIRRLAS